MAHKPVRISQEDAKKLWLKSQGLLERAPFGKGASATLKTIQHLGYVQIDTINVIERAHHHILWSRQPDYKLQFVHQLQSIDKSIFEYWTHALAYIPTENFRYYVRAMKSREADPGRWFQMVSDIDKQRVLAMVKKQGPISIRDVNDDSLVEKDHEWASKKPSKRVLQYLFNSGLLVVSERQGMLKKYEVTERHFGWKTLPKASSESDEYDYILDRSLTPQGFISLESVTHLMKAKHKKNIQLLIEKREQQGYLQEIQIKDVSGKFWASPRKISELPKIKTGDPLVHVLSPFDPLVIQRRRFNLLFGHDHRFEAYLPKEKRKYGYFALPVLFGSEVVALLDLKTDRAAQKLLLQKWSWLKGKKSNSVKAAIEDELHRFEKFQLAGKT